MKKYLKGEIYIVLASMCYGMLPILNTFVLKEGLSVNSLLFSRFFLVSIILYILIKVKKMSIMLPFKQIFNLFLQGGVLYLGISFCYASSIKYISVSLSVLIMFTYPVFIMLYVWLVKKQKQGFSSIVSLIISLVGISLIVGNSVGKVNVVGILLAFGAATFYVIYILASVNTAKQINPIVATFYICLSASLTVLILGISTGSLNLVITPVVCASVLLIAIVPTTLAIMMFLKGLKTVDEGRASIIAMLEPLFAIVFAVVILGQNISSTQIVGGIVLISGVLGIMGAYSRLINFFKN